jgi:hypothetical protein
MTAAVAHARASDRAPPAGLLLGVVHGIGV